MSDKNLLNEQTVRKFMKLAAIEPLASGFVQKLQEADEEVTEEKTEEVTEEKTEEVTEEKTEEVTEEGVEETTEIPSLEEDEDELEMDMGADEEMPMDADPMDDMGAGEAAGAEMIAMDDFLAALEKALAEVTGLPTEVDREEDIDAELAPADDMESGDMEMDMEMGAEEEEEEMDEQSQFMEAVYKKVLARLQEKK